MTFFEFERRSVERAKTGLIRILLLLSIGLGAMSFWVSYRALIVIERLNSILMAVAEGGMSRSRRGQDLTPDGY